jgi:hypothetical protein
LKRIGTAGLLASDDVKESGYHSNYENLRIFDESDEVCVMLKK